MYSVYAALFSKDTAKKHWESKLSKTTITRRHAVVLPSTAHLFSLQVKRKTDSKATELRNTAAGYGNCWHFKALLPMATRMSSKKDYRKVPSSRLSWLVAHPRIFRLFMKGNFKAYVLWPMDKMVQNWIVDQSTARDFTICTKTSFKNTFLK